MPDNIVEKVQLRKNGPKYDVRDNTKLPITGGTITGDLEITGDLSLATPLPINQGGTGAMTAADALVALQAAAAVHTHSQYVDSTVSRTKNTVLAAPSSSDGAASFRALVPDDIPVVPVNKGGTGATTAVTAAQNLRVLTLGEAYSYIPASGNLNGYTTPGVYSINTDAIAASLSNAPSTFAGVLRVWNAVGNNQIVGHVGDSYFYLCQEYVDRNARVWRRLGDSGSTSTITWWGWEQVLTTGRYTSNLNTLYDDLISAGNPSDPGAVALHFVNSSAQNAPNTGNGVVLTQKVGIGNWGSQLFINDNGVFYRSKKSGAWSDWIHIGTVLPSIDTVASRLTTADQNIENNELKWFHATASMSVNKPAGDGYILQFGWDNTSPSYSTQLFLKNGQDGVMQIRGRSADAWGPWKNVLVNGGTLTSYNVSGAYSVNANGSRSVLQFTPPAGYEYFANSVIGTEWEVVPHIVMYNGNPTLVLANVATVQKSTTLSGKVYFIKS